MGHGSRRKSKLDLVRSILRDLLLFKSSVSVILLWFVLIKGFKIEDTVTSTLIQINKPCKGSASDKEDNCGTIALFNRDLISGEHLITHSDLILTKEGVVFDKELPDLSCLSSRIPSTDLCVA